MLQDFGGNKYINPLLIKIKIYHKTLEGISTAKITNHMQYLSDNIHFKMCHKTSVGISTAKISGHSKKPSVRVELRAGEDPNRSEKLGWSSGDTR